MPRVTTALQTFNAGELSPKLNGRFNLDIYFNGCARMENFKPQTEGPLSFIEGKDFIWQTRNNEDTCLVPFNFGETQAYQLGFSNLKFRILKDFELVTLTAQNITNITKANPAVVTYSGADTYVNGDKIIIDNVVGMTQVNNKEFTVANVNSGANTFELLGINSITYTTYVSSGTIEEIVEVATPFAAADLYKIKYCQEADIMYLTCQGYRPQKITRTSHTAWTCADYENVGGPYEVQNITATTLSASGTTGSVTITASSALFSVGVIGGLWELAKSDGTAAGSFRITAFTDSTHVTATVVSALDASLSGTPSTKWKQASWDNGVKGWPRACALYEQRLFLGGTLGSPAGLWGSVTTEFENHRAGTNASDAVYNELTTNNGTVPNIRWISPADIFLVVGGFGSEHMITGGSQYEAITPTSINNRPIAAYGVHDIMPALVGSNLFYAQLTQRTLRSVEYDAYKNGYKSFNKSIRASHLLKAGIKQMALQQGQGASYLWQVMNDGQLRCVIIEPDEKILGFFRIKPAKTIAARGKVLSVGVIPQVNNDDAVYFVVERVINGQTVRYYEAFRNQPDIPEEEDYFTGDKDADEDAFLLAMYEAQKHCFHVDSGLTYDGSDLAIVTMTPGALTGDAVTFTAGSSFFTAGMVDRHIWSKAGGRARIDAVLGGTTATCRILVPFTTTNAIAIGEWYLTANTFTGLEHLEGESIVAVTDGGVNGDYIVANGSISLANQKQAGVCHLGLRYIGFAKTMALEGGGANGPAQTKPKSISNLGIKFYQTLGAKFGTDPYDMQRVDFRSTSDITNRPAPLFTGDKEVPLQDTWDSDKSVYLIQENPLPCTVTAIVPYFATNDT